jgi:hypothetical protein
LPDERPYLLNELFSKCVLRSNTANSAHDRIRQWKWLSFHFNHLLSLVQRAADLPRRGATSQVRRLFLISVAGWGQDLAACPIFNTKCENLQSSVAFELYHMIPWIPSLNYALWTLRCKLTLSCKLIILGFSVLILYFIILKFII